MRIWINDTQLDTYEGSVSVTKTNNLWKFGKAEFVHTQTVKIPATNNNKALLDFADEFRTQSRVARGFVDCLVDIDGVFEEGRLYVSGYANGEFSVIMTFGKELRSLDVKLVDAIKNIPAGVIINTISGFAYINVYDEDGALTEKVFTTTNYLLSLLKDNGVDVIDYDKFSVSGDGIAFESDAEDIGDVGTNIATTLRRTFYNGLVSSQTAAINPVYDERLLPTYLPPYFVTANRATLLQRTQISSSVAMSFYGKVSYFYFPFEVEVFFGAGSSDLSLNTIKNIEQYTTLFAEQHGHYRSYSGPTDYIGTEHVEDLSGQSVKVPKNTPFMILSYADFYNNVVSESRFSAGLFVSQNLRSFNVEISMPVFAPKFIPDITIYQLLQILAARRSLMLYFDGTKYTTTALDDILDKTTAFTVKEESKSSYSVSDKAFDFAQKNTLKYKSGVLETNLYINNLHIADKKTVLEVPFDGGTWKEVGVIAETDGGFPMYLNRNISTMNSILAALRFPYDLQAILAATRQVKVKFRMSYLDFTSVKELDNFEYRGAPLQWSSLQWSDGWCTATLQTLQ